MYTYQGIDAQILLLRKTGPHLKSPDATGLDDDTFRINCLAQVGLTWAFNQVRFLPDKFK